MNQLEQFESELRYHETRAEELKVLIRELLARQEPKRPELKVVVSKS